MLARQQQRVGALQRSINAAEKAGLTRKDREISDIIIRREHKHTFTINTSEQASKNVQRIRNTMLDVSSQGTSGFEFLEDDVANTQRVRASQGKQKQMSLCTLRMTHATITFERNEIPSTDVGHHPFSTDIARLFREWDNPAAALLQIKGVSVPAKYYSQVFAKNVPEAWEVMKKPYSEWKVSLNNSITLLLESNIYE